MQWYRSINIIKEVSKRYVLLKIPLYSIPVKSISVESWKFSERGNEIHILLKREEVQCPIEKILEEKRNNFERFAVYPGEKLQ